MIYRLKILALFWCALSVPGLAFAGVEQISEEEFRALALELAPKVSLFREVWAKDPKAEFYGGTTRDYLYWLKGKFRDAHTPAEAQKIAQGLRTEKVIDHRNFLFSESDADIVTTKNIDISAEEFGLRKIDFQSGDVFDPKTTVGFDDRHQGFIPAEKIRIGQKSLQTNATTGDGVREIYQGKLSVHFASPKDFAKTTYAKSKENHPILLAARYLRLQAMNYYQNHGSGFPDPKKLMEGVRPEDAKVVKAVIAEATRSSDFASYIIQPRLRSWLNGSIRKAFRSYTNPTAAMELFREFGMDNLVAVYGNHLAPINQFLFAKNRDEKKIAATLAKFHVNPQELYVPAKKFFPDGYIYHGTRGEDAFRGILLQGILPSEAGLAGEGLYGVAEKNKSFSEEWGGGKDRLVRLPVSPEAKIVDIESGPGRTLWNAFGGDFEAFAEAVGADMLKYPYQKEAFVVKNSSVLGKPEGVYRQVLTLSEIFEQARKNPAKARGLLLSDNFSTFSSSEVPVLIDTLKPDSATLTSLLGGNATRGLKHEDLVKILHDAKLSNEQLVSVLMHRQILRGRALSPEEAKSIAPFIRKDAVSVKEIFSLLDKADPKDFSTTFQALLDSTVSLPGWEKHPELVSAVLESITKQGKSQFESLFRFEKALESGGWKKHPEYAAWSQKIKASRANGQAVKTALLDPAQKLSSENVVELLKDSALSDLDILETLHFRSYDRIGFMSPEENEAVGRLLKASPIPEKDLKAFFQRMKAADRGNGPRNVIEQVVQYPGWEKHPEIIDAILETPEFSGTLSNLSYAFDQEGWQKSPRMLDWLEKIADPSDSFTSGFVLRALAAQPDSPRKMALTKKFVDAGNPRTDLELLRSVFKDSLGTREQLQTILDRTPSGEYPYINYADFVEGPLSRHPWNKEIAWVEKISQEAVRLKEVSLGAELAKFFSKNYFPGRADLLEPLLTLQKGLVGYDEMQEVFKLWSKDPEIAAYLKDRKLTQTSLAEMLKARAKGGKSRLPAASCAPNFAKFGH